MTTQTNSREVPEFAFFSDTLRDALKGDVFNSSKAGYVSGVGAYASTINSCFRGAPAWCKSPTQTVNYASCHDNHTLYDRIALSTPDATEADRIRMNNLAAAIVLTSQGVPFIHAGEEMLRSKPLPDGGFDHNSYNNTDEVNNLKWSDLNREAYQTVNNYYKGLIAFRAEHPALRMTGADEVAEKIVNLSGLDFGVTGFHIASGANGEENEFIVVFNPRAEATTVTIPAGEWGVYVSGQQAGTEVLGTAVDTVTVEPISATVLVREVRIEETVPATTAAAEVQPAEDSNAGNPVIPVAVCAAIVVALIALVLIKKRKK